MLRRATKTGSNMKSDWSPRGWYLACVALSRKCACSSTIAAARATGQRLAQRRLAQRLCNSSSGFESYTARSPKH